MSETLPPSEPQLPHRTETHSSASDPEALLMEKKAKSNRWMWIGAAVLAVVVVGAILVRALVPKGFPEGLIQANGRIEGDRVSVASKVPGRIARMLAREGDSVTNGQVLAVMEEAQTQAKLAQAKAGVAALTAQWKAAQTSLEVLRLEVPLSIQLAEVGVVHARAILAKAVAGAEQANRDAQRFRELLISGSVEKHRSEMADLAATTAGSELQSARTGLTHAENQEAQSRLGELRLRAHIDGVAALAAHVEQGRALVVESETVLGDLTLIAPISGVITTRVRDAGEVIAAGSPVFDLVNLDRLYLKVYVPESQIGQVRLDLPARIHIDSLPDQFFPAITRYIASRAEFTPKEVQTTDERVKLVYAVKLYVTENPAHRLTPGLPADAVICWQEGVEWRAPEW